MIAAEATINNEFKVQVDLLNGFVPNKDLLKKLVQPTQHESRMKEQKFSRSRLGCIFTYQQKLLSGHKVTQDVHFPPIISIFLFLCIQCSHVTWGTFNVMMVVWWSVGNCGARCHHRHVYRTIKRTTVYVCFLSFNCAP